MLLRHLPILCVLVVGAVLAAESPLCLVRFRFLLPNGGSANDARVVSLLDADNNDLTTQLDKDAQGYLRAGTYSVLIRTPSLRSGSIVRVVAGGVVPVVVWPNEPDRSHLETSWFSCGPRRNAAGAWARLIAAYDGSFERTGLTSKEGTCTFEGVRSGDYLLLIMQEDRLVETKVVRKELGKSRLTDISPSSSRRMLP